MALNGGQQSCEVLDSVGVLFAIEILLFFSVRAVSLSSLSIK